MSLHQLSCIAYNLLLAAAAAAVVVVVVVVTMSSGLICENGEKGENGYHTIINRYY